MKVRTIIAVIAMTWSVSAMAGEFTGDTKDACEALLCLSSGSRPSECSPPLRRYFSISARKLSDTIRKRKNFLKLCPTASSDENMQSLTDALANSAGRCDVDTLNQRVNRFRRDEDGQYGYVSNVLPSYCQSLYNHPYLTTTLPKYVGTPSTGGYWVAADQYEAALAEYNKRQAETANNWNGNGWADSSR